MPQVTQFNQGKQDGSVTPPPSPPFKLNGNIYRAQVETVVTDGNIKSSAIQLQKEVTTRSGKDFVTYATSNDGGKTWINGSGGKGSTPLSTSGGLTADEVKGLQPGGNLNKATVNAANQSAVKAGASKTQQEQLKAGNDTNAQKPAESPTTPTDVSGTISEAISGTNKGISGTLYYPKDLASSNQDKIKFDILKYNPRGLQSGTFGKEFGGESRQLANRDANRGALATIWLPIPGGISDTNTAGWGDDKMNAFQLLEADIALKSITEGLGKGAAVLGRAADSAGDPGTNEELRTALTNKFASLALQGENSTILSRTTGQVLNPNLELLFTGPELRSFSFTFKMSARGKPEADEIIKIIRTFKQSMSPQKSQSQLFAKAPNTFRIQYFQAGNKEHTRIGKIKECALVSMTTNYTPEGQYATYYDGTMVSYEIQMQFKELEPIFNDEYGALDGANGSTHIGF